MLDATRLRVLVAIARHGSVTAAAQALNYAQPSISHHMARLEAETGAKLMERSGRGVRLTEAGQLLAERAEEILGRLDAAEAELAAHLGLRQERVRVAAFGSALGTLVAAAGAALQAAMPQATPVAVRTTGADSDAGSRGGEIGSPGARGRDSGGGHGGGESGGHGARGRDSSGRNGGGDGRGSTAGTSAMASQGARARQAGLDLVVRQAEPAEALRLLRIGEADVAVIFRYTSQDAGDPVTPGSWPDGQSPADGLHLRCLLDEPVYLLTRAAVPRARTAPDAGRADGAPVTAAAPLPALADYAGGRWIAGCEQCSAVLVRLCAQAGFSPDIAVSTDDYLAVQALVAAGFGAAVLPGLAIGSARHHGVVATELPGTRRQVLAATIGASSRIGQRTPDRGAGRRRPVRLASGSRQTRHPADEVFTELARALRHHRTTTNPVHHIRAARQGRNSFTRRLFHRCDIKVSELMVRAWLEQEASICPGDRHVQQAGAPQDLARAVRSWWPGQPSTGRAAAA